MDRSEYRLQTERFSLELLSESDASDIWPHVSDPEISENMSWEAHKTIDETLLFIKNVESAFETGRAVSWGIRFEGKIIGIFSVISILRHHRLLIYDKAELAYWLGKEYQGKGIMTEAGMRILDFAFNNMKLNKIYVGFHEGNKGSQGLIERLKFPYSHKEKEAFKKNDVWIDVQYYQMLKSDYIKLYK